MDIGQLLNQALGKFSGAFIVAAGAGFFSLLVSIVLVGFNLVKNLNKLSIKLSEMETRVNHVSSTMVSILDFIKPVLVTTHTLLDISTNKVQNGNVDYAYTSLREAECKYQDTLLNGSRMAHCHEEEDKK